MTEKEDKVFTSVDIRRAHQAASMQMTVIMGQLVKMMPQIPEELEEHINMIAMYSALLISGFGKQEALALMEVGIEECQSGNTDTFLAYMERQLEEKSQEE